MIKVMAVIIYIFLLFTAIVSVAPWGQVWHWGNGLCIALIGLGLLIFVGPPDGGPYGDDGQEFAEVLYGLIVAAVAAPFLLRFVAHTVRYANAKDAPTTDPWPWLLQFLNGCTTSIVFFAFLGDTTAGTPHAIAIHMALLGLCILLVGAGFFLCATLINGMGIGLAILILFSATYPYQIHWGAMRAADGAPYCIYHSQRGTFATRGRDLTYLTFDKTAHQAHAVLIIELPQGQRYANWSYMRGRFMLPWDVWVHQPNLKCPH